MKKQTLLPVVDVYLLSITTDLIDPIWLKQFPPSFAIVLESG
jgi:hypothetical protein